MPNNRHGEGYGGRRLPCPICRAVGAVPRGLTARGAHEPLPERERDVRHRIARAAQLKAAGRPLTRRPRCQKGWYASFDLDRRRFLAAVDGRLRTPLTA